MLQSQSARSIFINFPCSSSTTSSLATFPIAIPSTVTPGSLYTRFRYSLTPGIGVGGQAEAGEVEDHLFTINASANLANPDAFTVTRNSQANILNVLANDFETATSQLLIKTAGPTTNGGVVLVANGGRSVIYTPATGFTGNDSFDYTVVNSAGQSATAKVTVNVSFLSDVPIPTNLHIVARRYSSLRAFAKNL